MGKFDEYLEMAKDLAEDAGDVAKQFAGEIASKAKELTDDGRKVKELKQAAKEQASSLAFGAREKVQGVLQDAKVSKEIKQGIAELEALPECEGSILYSMELNSMINYLKSLLLVTNDNRMDDGSVAEEIKKVMSKVLPATEPQAEAQVGDAEEAATGSSVEVEAPAFTAEEQAIEKAKAIVYAACTRALETLKTQ